MNVKRYCKECFKIVECGSVVDESGKYPKGLLYCLECGNEVSYQDDTKGLFKCKFCKASYFAKDKNPVCCQKAFDTEGNTALTEEVKQNDRQI
jgi:hypothetical protein